MLVRRFAIYPELTHEYHASPHKYSLSQGFADDA